MLTKEELKDGMIIRNNVTNTSYLVTDAKQGELLSISSGVYGNLPNVGLSDWDILDAGLPKHPSKVYVVTTIIQEGMEFEGHDYCGVFTTKEKAKKYFESEKRDWFDKFNSKYDTDGDTITIYKDKEYVWQINANEYQDCVTITIREKGVQ